MVYLGLFDNIFFNYVRIIVRMNRMNFSPGQFLPGIQ